jgi:hypothetical protein
MKLTSEESRRQWRVTLQPDGQDAVAKALRHSRFDLWYGAHYLRFTKTLRSDGTLMLRIQERARLASPGDPGSVLLTAEHLSSPFGYEQSLSVSGVAPAAPAIAWEDAESLVLAVCRDFFDQVARRLDSADHG